MGLPADDATLRTLAEGELPFQPRIGARYRFVDATTGGDGYVTLDYGTDGDGTHAVFVGRELSYVAAGMAELAPQAREPEARGAARECPHCGAPLSLKSEGAKSLVCDSCRGLCDLSDGKLALVALLGERSPPALPLGSRGRLRGETRYGQGLGIVAWGVSGVRVSRVQRGQRR